MIKNFLKTAWRNLMKYKFISLINLFGLTVGLTCCLLITTYILNELSYDKYDVNANRIYRVTRTFYNSDGTTSLTLSTVAPPFGPLLQNDFPDIEEITRLYPDGISPLRYGEKLFNEQNCFWAEENVFDFFTIKTLEGNRSTALRDPYSVMMTEEMAKKYFGNEDPMNKIIRYNNQFDFKVTGVFKAFPENAHLHPQMMFSFCTQRDSAVYGDYNLRHDWGNNSFFTYIMLPKNYPVEGLEKRFPVFVDKYMQENYVNTGMKPSKATSIGLQKFTDIHLYSHTDYEAEANGDISRIYIFSAIALFILLIACINYMNLSTARSALRAKEIGIRKVVGASKKSLVTQFLSESVLLVWIASLLAFALTFFSLPMINSFTGLQLSFSILFRWQVLIALLLTPFIVGGISGVYPSIFMSSFQPVKTLKGLFKAGNTNISLRKILVVFQFSISIILIITTIIVFQQLGYIQNSSLGFNKEQMVIVPFNSSKSMVNNYENFRSQLLQNANIKGVTISSRIPSGRLLDDMNAYTLVADSMRPLNADIKFVNVDYDFIPAYGITMAAGRNFSREYGTDTSSFVINESALQLLGWKRPQDAVGKDFKYGNILGHIIGVMKDFHFEDMHEKIIPLVFINLPVTRPYYNNLSIKITSGNPATSLAIIEKTWKEVYPDVPYQYAFLDDKFETLYNTEQKQGTLFTIFAAIAIFIACLGLFGLSAFTIIQKIKEIGVRKVLGASVGSIVALLSKDFLKLVFISSFIAFPVAWYAMNNWLNDFAYRISIEWWVFIIAAISAALIALFTISFQAIKAAIANPVKSLRTE